MEDKNIIDKATDGFVTWCAKDTPGARLQRTIVQGVIGVACSAVAYYITGDGVASIVVAPAIMAILSPIQKAIGNKGEVDEA